MLRKNNGFTLIEILIVLLIISIVSGVAILSIRSNPNRQLELFADRFINLLNLASEEAMFRPDTIGLFVSNQSYHFSVYRKKHKTQKEFWDPIPTGPLSEHKYPKNWQLVIKIQNEVVTSENGQPQIIITPSGDFDPFIILIGEKNKNPRFEIKVQANGEIKRETITAK